MYFHVKLRYAKQILQMSELWKYNFTEKNLCVPMFLYWWQCICHVESSESQVTTCCYILYDAPNISNIVIKWLSYHLFNSSTFKRILQVLKKWVNVSHRYIWGQYFNFFFPLFKQFSVQLFFKDRSLRFL